MPTKLYRQFSRSDKGSTEPPKFPFFYRLEYREILLQLLFCWDCEVFYSRRKRKKKRPNIFLFVRKIFTKWYHQHSCKSYLEISWENYLANSCNMNLTGLFYSAHKQTLLIAKHL